MIQIMIKLTFVLLVRPVICKGYCSSSMLLGIPNITFVTITIGTHLFTLSFHLVIFPLAFTDITIGKSTLALTICPAILEIILVTITIGKQLFTLSFHIAIRGCTGEMAKIFFLLITMKLASLVEIAMLIIYHQGTKENF